DPAIELIQRRALLPSGDVRTQDGAFDRKGRLSWNRDIAKEVVQRGVGHAAAAPPEVEVERTNESVVLELIPEPKSVAARTERRLGHHSTFQLGVTTPDEAAWIPPNMRSTRRSRNAFGAYGSAVNRCDGLDRSRASAARARPKARAHQHGPAATSESRSASPSSTSSRDRTKVPARRSTEPLAPSPHGGTHPRIGGKTQATANLASRSGTGTPPSGRFAAPRTCV